MARSTLGHSGTCATCGRFAWLWVGDGPQQCDDCHQRERVRADYASDAELARRIYAAADAAGALRLMGVSSGRTPA